MREKLAFALVMASRKLRHYFLAHVINVLTDYPLKKAMNKLEAVGRLIQLAIKLSKFDVRYQPRSAIKAQVLADFIAEFTPNQGVLDEMDEAQRWVVYVDGSTTLYARGIGVVLKSPKGDKLKYTTRLQYQTTNNEAEYETLLKGLELAKSLGAELVLVHRDSQLIINQEASFVQVPRKENMEADVLVKVALIEGAMDEYDKVQYMPSTDLLEVQQITEEGNWMTPIVVYLKDGRLLENKDEARKLRIKAAKYVLKDKVLYKRGFFQPYLRCLAPDESNYVLREVHERACGNHSEARALVHKVICPSYYWPTIQVDAKAYVKVGVPRVLVSDNGRQFDNTPFRDFCENFGIKNHYFSPSHPQANGQAEVAN
ncbi:uncharacterized protein LOC142605996 [Castanea sativa]|uniref:uncharacterized protein LOC142605996 n=1 Tax=Castanea sativa TaxID=21020 RepID=UPI003F6525A4